MKNKKQRVPATDVVLTPAEEVNVPVIVIEEAVTAKPKFKHKAKSKHKAQSQVTTEEACVDYKEDSVKADIELPIKAVLKLTKKVKFGWVKTQIAKLKAFLKIK